MAELIRIHAIAPDKPPAGQPCNGCGVCCALEPCPAGIAATRRVRGPCTALTWVESAARYRCGLIVRPADFLPRPFARAAPLAATLARRCISAGSGCDCDVEVEARTV